MINLKKCAAVSAVVGGFLLAPRPAPAAYLTGNDLLAACQSNDQKDILTCMGYVAGVVDYQVMMQSMGSEPTAADFCLPPDLSMQKAAVTVLLYLRHTPQNGSFIAAPAVLMALSQAYPCAPLKPRKKRHHG